jgi:hypothetical protein
MDDTRISPEHSRSQHRHEQPLACHGFQRFRKDHATKLKLFGDNSKVNILKVNAGFAAFSIRVGKIYFCSDINFIKY